MAEVAELLTRVGAADVYVLPAVAARRLVAAREKAFWTAKRAGADNIVNAVVPRAADGRLLGEVARIAARRDRLVLSAGHAGDGNVQLALFEPDAAARGQMTREILAAAQAAAVSGEHGIGTAKVSYFLELADPVGVADAADQGLVRPGGHPQPRGTVRLTGAEVSDGGTKRCRHRGTDQQHRQVRPAAVRFGTSRGGGSGFGAPNCEPANAASSTTPAARKPHVDGVSSVFVGRRAGKPVDQAEHQPDTVTTLDGKAHEALMMSLLQTVQLEYQPAGKCERQPASLLNDTGGDSVREALGRADDKALA